MIDADEDGEIDRTTVRFGTSVPKQLTVNVDRDVVGWFTAQGAGYQSRTTFAGAARSTRTRRSRSGTLIIGVVTVAGTP